MSRGTLDPAVSLSFSPTGLSPSLAGLSRTVWLTIGNHLCSPNPAMHAWRFGLFPFRSPLLWKSKIFFLFLRLLRCFSSPGSPPYSYGFTVRYMRVAHVGFPIQTPAGHWICAPLRSFSQLIASFIGSQCQGIRPVPFFA